MLTEYPSNAIAMTTRPNSDSRKSFTAEACDGLDGIVSAIDEKLEHLVQRLQPVICPRPTLGRNDAAPPQPQAEPNALARRLQIVMGRLQTIDERIVCLLQTLDL